MIHNRMLMLLFAASVILTACSPGKTATCSISDYADYYYNNSQKTHCEDQFGDAGKLYGFGEMSGPESQEMMLKRTSHAKAVDEVGRKAAGLQNKIKGSIEEVIFNDENGNSSTKTWFETEFEIKLNEVAKVGEVCENGQAGFTCYTLVEMPKTALLETASAALGNEDEVLHQKWKASQNYKNLLAELE